MCLDVFVGGGRALSDVLLLLIEACVFAKRIGRVPLAPELVSTSLYISVSLSGAFGAL